LLALVSVPLVLGMNAGAQAVVAEQEEFERKERSRWSKFGAFIGFICASLGLLDFDDITS